MTDDVFTLELRALVKKYYPDNLGHQIEIDLPNGNYQFIKGKDIK